MTRLLHSRLLARSLMGALVAAALPVAATAQLTHTARSGDTLGSIAARHYGAAWKQTYIGAVNDLDDDAKLRPGQRVKIPVVWMYKMRRGDSLPSVANRVLGDSKRYVFLARFNGIQDMSKVKPGTRLMIPIQIKHRVGKGDSLTGLARRYYRNGRMRFLLRDYNFLPTTKVEAGAVVVVPIFDREAELSEVRGRLEAAGRREARATEAAARPPATKSAPTRPAKKPPRHRTAEASSQPTDAEGSGDEQTTTADAGGSADEDGSAALEPAADPGDPDSGGTDGGLSDDDDTVAAELDASILAGERSFREGEYEDAATAFRELMERLRSASPARQARAHRGLAFALVALERKGEALVEFRRMVELVPTATLDPVLTSPKILEVYRQARDELEEREGAQSDESTRDGGE